ncbi:MAG: hypothetical protein Q4G25_12670 [Paracoccus sp. (in: a-proteobacteria)]|nr:hypothetical protein [Paracoccus sp. (in: a-proteobacteria)]
MVTDCIHEAIAMAARIRAQLRVSSARAVLEMLVAGHGFTWTNDRDPQRLRGLGVSCSCTSGPHGLLVNWIAAVERRAASRNTNPRKETK